ncbi:Choline-sulfatase [Planctomycetes bacterium MalM25]|nr:Choline-sulfatase [Planctomycetes bacterium MalM25]
MGVGTMRFCSMLAMLVWAGCGVWAGAAEKPNLLWIITDDQRADSIVAFNKIMTGQADSALGPVSSPNVDRLAAEGTTFINAYCQSPACAPSRAAMHSGRYPHHSGVYGFEQHHANNPEFAPPTVPKVLAAAGYQTSIAGKLGERTISWDGKRFRWGQLQYDQEIAPFKVMRRAGLTDWLKEEIWAGGKYGGRTESFWFSEEESLDLHVPAGEEPGEEFRRLAAEATERLDLLRHRTGDGVDHRIILGGVSGRKAGETRDGYYLKALEQFLANPDQEYLAPWGKRLNGPDTSKPQFINLGFDFPHTPVLPPASYREEFQQYTYKIPQPAEGEIAAFPPQIQGMYKQKQSDHYSSEELQQMVQDYYAFCAYGDELVGGAAEAFKQYSEKQGRPWMIVYVCGDHGWRLNEHGMISKFGPWGIDTHDPIIVVSSDKEKFPAGKVVTDFAEFVDMAPTFYAAAGLDVESEELERLDGYDLAQVAAGEKRPRDYVLSEGWWVSGPRACIRTKDYLFSMKVKPKRVPIKDMKWALDATMKQVEPLLYDLRVDPGETNNVAFDKRYKSVAWTLRSKLQDVVLGDDRIEIDWSAGFMGKAERSRFALGADDKRLMVPQVETN